MYPELTMLECGRDWWRKGRVGSKWAQYYEAYFGNKKIEALTTTINDRMRSSWFTAPQSGSIKDMLAYLYIASTGDKCACAIYNKTADPSTDTLVAYTAEQTNLPTGNNWVLFSFPDPKPSVVAGLPYWLVVWGYKATAWVPTVRYKAETGKGQGRYIVYNYPNWPNPFWGSYESTLLSIYARYA